MRVTVGLVVPALASGGGVTAVARFLTETLEESQDFEVRHFSVPMSASDTNSVRLASPLSWVNKPQVAKGEWEGNEYRHFGAILPEFEFQRFKPRSKLTNYLNRCDVIQVVAGCPAWGLVARDVNRPVALQVATLIDVERRQRFREERGIVTGWRKLMTRITARLDREGANTADRIIVENRWMKGTLEDWLDPARVLLVPPGVDCELFRPVGTTEREKGSSYILSVGRFDDPRKNVRLLFEAYAKLFQDGVKPPPLMLVGKTGPREKDWRRASELGIRNHIKFRRNVSRKRLAELYRCASLFVLSSSEEGLGIVILEAMASGLPVVSTATQGARQAVEDGRTGLLTPVGDVSTLSRTIGRLLQDKESLREMGRAARGRAKRRFSYEVAGRRFKDIYREMIDPDIAH